MMSKKINCKHNIIKGISLIFLILVSLGQFVFAQKRLPGEKLIESFVTEIVNTGAISDSFVSKYIASNEEEKTIPVIKRSLNELKTTWLPSKEKLTKLKIIQLHIADGEPNSKFYSIQIDSDRALNFAVDSDKITSITLFQTSNYNTFVFF